MTPGYAFAFFLAVLIGMSLGALGSGGSIVTLPVLVYVAHIETGSAVGMSMAVVGVTSLAAAWLHWKRGNFHTPAALLLGISGIIGAYFGSALTRLVSPSTLMLIFAGLMVAVGVFMFRGGVQGLTPGRCRPVRCLVIGLAIGLLTGFLGVGGGFILVPALVLLAGVDTRAAVGTSLAIIAMNSFAGLAGQLRYAPVDWRLTSAFIAFALVGMWAGLTFTRRVGEETLRNAFASLLIVVGVVVATLNF